MVAFPTVAEIKLKNPSDECFVGLVPEIIPFIEKWQGEPCLSAEEVAAIVELLKLNSEKVHEMEMCIRDRSRSVKCLSSVNLRSISLVIRFW